MSNSYKYIFLSFSFFLLPNDPSHSLVEMELPLLVAFVLALPFLNGLCRLERHLIEL